jgi:hypothetical protein
MKDLELQQDSVRLNFSPHFFVVASSPDKVWQIVSLFAKMRQDYMKKSYLIHTCKIDPIGLLWLFKFQTYFEEYEGKCQVSSD